MGLLNTNLFIHRLYLLVSQRGDLYLWKNALASNTNRRAWTLARYSLVPLGHQSRTLQRQPGMLGNGMQNDAALHLIPWASRFLALLQPRQVVWELWGSGWRDGVEASSKPTTTNSLTLSNKAQTVQLSG